MEHKEIRKMIVGSLIFDIIKQFENLPTIDDDVKKGLEELIEKFIKNYNGGLTF